MPARDFRPETAVDGRDAVKVVPDLAVPDLILPIDGVVSNCGLSLNAVRILCRLEAIEERSGPSGGTWK